VEIGIDVTNAAPPTKFLGLEHWPLARLVPSPRNARTHSDAQVAEIAGSIRTFGFANPILVSEKEEDTNDA
jgi:ParB-like chromosome segregation protein Spo0J